LQVVALVFFIRWFSETDLLMGHTKGAPTDIFTAFATAAIGMIVTVVWFALAVYLKLASSRSNTSLANHHGIRRLQGGTLALLVMPSGLILMVAGSEIPMAIEMQKTERLERTAHGPGGTSTVTELVDVLKNDRSSYRRGLAVDALERMGPEAKDAVSALIEALDEPGVFGRFTVPMALANIGSAAVPEITRAMHEHGSARVRSGCAKALGFMGPAAGEAADALQKSLHDSDADVRMAAAESLGRIGHENAADRVSMLEEAVSDSDESLKGRAIRELGQIGPAAKNATPTLRAALRDSKPGIRLDAAYSLWRTDRNAEEVVPVLAQLLEVPTEYRYRVNVPATAAYYLGRIGPAASGRPLSQPCPGLIDMIKAPSPNSTNEIGLALQALTRIDPETAVAIIQEQPEAFKALKQQDYTAASMQYEAYLGRLRRKAQRPGP
jgi:HEAT repeat protein